MRKRNVLLYAEEILVTHIKSEKYFKTHHIHIMISRLNRCPTFQYHEGFFPLRRLER